MSNSFFYLQKEKNTRNSDVLTTLEEFSEKNHKQLYIIDKPLGDNRYNYNSNDFFIICFPDHKIVFVNCGDSSTSLSFDDYFEDVLEDIGTLSDKFRYKDKIGRPRQWKDLLTVKVDDTALHDTSTFFNSIALHNENEKKVIELIISLFTGSINDIDKVNFNSEQSTLDKIKQRIILFDGDQTRFIYQKSDKKIVRIQGLSGTGKTELLLHKIKELYVSEDMPNTRILFTCHNKILASSLKKRIPDFFDFMKVEQQILWEERLWCVSAWGSLNDKDSGAYRYICAFYDIPFMRFSRVTNFDYVCKNAIKTIEQNNLVSSIGFAFDYILLDESQDFPESFITLCSLITKETVYVAGDIFQSIFDEDIVSEITPDHLLSKCYRTDPRTLMFAHALGMGLFEKPKLRWLEDKEWIACGYKTNYSENKQVLHLTREPLRRFSDLGSSLHPSVQIIRTSAAVGEVSETKIIEVIDNIRKEHPSVTVDDIGIIFIDNNEDYVYAAADNLYFSIPKHFGWNVNKAYESKSKIKDTLFLSNKNNVKGLEFPFVICVTKKIKNNHAYRNALYMMLTRSFITSYLLINHELNNPMLDILDVELDKINRSGSLSVAIPTTDEISQIKTTIKYTDASIPFYDKVHDIFDEMAIPHEYREKLYDIVKTTLGENFDRERIKMIINFNASIIIV